MYKSKVITDGKVVLPYVMESLSNDKPFTHLAVEEFIYTFVCLDKHKQIYTPPKFEPVWLGTTLTLMHVFL